MGLPDFFKSLLQRQWRTVVVIFGISLDIAIHAVSFLIAGGIYLDTSRLDRLLLTIGGLFALSSSVYLIAFTMFGVYRTLAYSSFRAQLYRAMRAIVVGTPIILSIVFLSARTLFFRPSFYILFLFTFPSVYLLVWSLARFWTRRLKDSGFGRANTIAIGSDPDFDRLLRRVDEHPELGYNVISVVYTEGHDPREGLDHLDVHKVKRLVKSKNIDQIIFSSSYQLDGSFSELQEICVRNRIAMRIVSPEADLLFTKAGLRDIAGVPVYVPERARMDRLKRGVKRFFDIVGSVMALILLSPLFLAVAAAIKLESPGPAFFRQLRSLGPGSKSFDFMKFRSMRKGAHVERDFLNQSNDSCGALFKIKNDPRVTRVGRFIRKYSIDEFPQLFNVLKGEMSLVGPRPLPVNDYRSIVKEDHLEGYVHRRAQVKPGMTGLWQISGRSDLGFREMVLLDLYYVENQTLLYDIEILAQTLPVVLFGKGAY